MFLFVASKELDLLDKKTPKRPPKVPFKWFFVAFFIILSAWAAYDWLQNDDTNKVDLSAKRKEQFLKDSARLEDCVQYVLFADENGFYPCYSCLDSSLIYLNKGEVWYYGETCYEKTRYSDSQLQKLLLLFKVQFRGNKAAVILEQKRKIYNYPLLPEAIKRNFSIIRPPGNKQDN